jgi:hypothetical protein
VDGVVVTRLPLALRLNPERAAIGVALLGAVLAAWNAITYPSGAGYDAASHREYADFLIQHHRLPHRNETPEYYSPPLYYAIAGAVTWVGRQAGLADPHKLGQLLNVPAVFGTVLLVVALGRMLWPELRWLPVAAGAFVALSPVLQRTAAMFHPEPTDLFASALCAYLAVRLLVQPRRSLWAAAGLGAALGASQMIRQFGLYTLAVVVLAWLAALVSNARDRGSLARSLAVALAVCAVIAAPWYAYRAAHYANPIFDRPHSAKPFLERRPARFYLGTGLPQVFTAPYRPEFKNRLWPQTYTDIWGDWYGVFAWSAEHGNPSAATRTWLGIQNVVGLLPTLLALAGWLVLLASSLRRLDAARLIVALMPLAGLAGYLYFAIGYPTPDGDVLKPTFMLSALWAWALCFAWSASWLARRLPRLTLWALVVLALGDLPFLVYRGGVGFF